TVSAEKFPQHRALDQTCRESSPASREDRKHASAPRGHSVRGALSLAGKFSRSLLPFVSKSVAETTPSVSAGLFAQRFGIHCSGAGGKWRFTHRHRSDRLLSSNRTAQPREFTIRNRRSQRRTSVDEIRKNIS